MTYLLVIFACTLGFAAGRLNAKDQYRMGYSDGARMATVHHIEALVKQLIKNQEGDKDG